MTIVTKGDVDSLTRYMLSMRAMNMDMYCHNLGLVRRMSKGENGGVAGFRNNTTIRASIYPGYTDADFKEVLRRLGEENLPLL
jgi:hypothetical protein